jgi:hypothetical protein
MSSFDATRMFPKNPTPAEHFENPIEKSYKIDTLSTQIHEYLLFRLGTGTSIKTQWWG